MGSRLGYFLVIVLAIMAINAAGSAISTLFEAVLEAVALAFLLPLILRRAGGGQQVRKPVSSRLKAFFLGQPEQAIDYETKPVKPRLRD